MLHVENACRYGSHVISTISSFVGGHVVMQRKVSQCLLIETLKVSKTTGVERL
jgi:hypothetical protein